jgi:phospholipid/cholesterol/gamma-HCH transport system substrate-binding protein
LLTKFSNLKFAISKEVKIALLTIITSSMLYTGFNFLKGHEAFSKSNYYAAYYHNVDGLLPGNPVYLNGMNVGQVKELELTPENKIKVTLQVQASIELSDSTVAKLMDGSLLGGKEIMLKMKPGTKILEDGATIRSELEVGMSENFMNQAEPILKGVDKTLGNVNNVLNTENQQKISQLLSNLEAVSSHLKETIIENRQSLSSTTHNLDKLTASLVETEKKLNPILNNLNILSDSLKDMQLKSTVMQVNKTVADLDETINKINKGKGTLGKMVNEDSLYTHLNKTIKDLDELFLDMKARPKRYVHFSVFGKKE